LLPTTAFTLRFPFEFLAGILFTSLHFVVKLLGFLASWEFLAIHREMEVISLK